jgi:hypothetical protein
VRNVVALSSAGAVCALVGGIVYWATDGGTSLARSIAYACWFAATLVLVASLVAGRGVIWRRTNLPIIESWVFVTSAIVLTALGAVIDAIGS